MGDGVGGPGVLGFEINCFFSHGLRTGIIATLLETEGRHAENGVIPFIVLAPRPQRLQRPVPEIELSSSEETSDMGVLQSQKIVRMILR